MVVLVYTYSSAWFYSKDNRGYILGAGFLDKAFIKVIIKPLIYYFKFL